MKNLVSWNRKLHIHVGLFLLLFIWLFSFSGLLLNHHWKFAEFWEQRKKSESVTDFVMAAPLDSAAEISAVMKKLEISGEVTNVKYTADALDFRVGSPGFGHELHVDRLNGTVSRKAYEFNMWGKIRTLHTFNGVDKNNAQKNANWFVTLVWKVAMDGVAVALVFLCVSSWVMWYRIRRQYKWGALALSCGFAICIYFVYLVRFL